MEKDDQTPSWLAAPRLRTLRNVLGREPHKDEPEEEPDGSASTSLSEEAVLAIHFVAEAGKQLLESSTSVAEVVDELRQFLPVVGLEGTAIDATPSTLTLSCWLPGQSAPVTTMQEVHATRPRLEQFMGTVSLLERIERGEIGLAAAYVELRDLRKTRGIRQEYLRAAILLSVVGWVLFLNGLTVTTVLVALLATLLTFPIDSLVRRMHMPDITAIILAAIVLVALPNLLAGAGLSFSVSAAVVGGLFIYLPGRALVSAVIDGLNNAPVSAMSRGLLAIITAGALAFGVILGSQIGAGLGVELTVDTTATPLWLSVLGAAVGVLGLALAWGMPRSRVMPSVAIGAAAWLIVALATRAGGADWTASFVAAVVVGFFGVFVANRQGGGASVYTGVAILPLVPGFTLYQAMLALTEGAGEAAGKLAEAVVVSLAIAAGVAVGLALGRNLEAAGTWIAAHRRR